jgi:hypothetical protein
MLSMSILMFRKNEGETLPDKCSIVRTNREEVIWIVLSVGLAGTGTHTSSLSHYGFSLRS